MFGWLFLTVKFWPLLENKPVEKLLQGRLIIFFAFVDVDGAPDIAVEAGVEQMGGGFCGLDSVV